MRLTTAVILAVLGVAAYQLIPQGARWLDVSLGKAASGDEGPEPARELSRSDLTVVHGRVESVDKDVVVVRCTTMDEFRIYGRPELVGRMDLKVYGPLLETSGDGLMHATWRPAAQAKGVARVEGYPQDSTLRKGRGVNVIAAPLGSERFTMRYKVNAAGPTKPGSWMWDARQNPLDKKAPIGRR